MNNNELDKYITVSQLNNYVKKVLDSDIHLREVYLKGEISRFVISNNNGYFTLKDESNVTIDAVIFNSNLKGLNFNPKHGDKVFVVGSVSIYKQTGKYQITVRSMQLDGIGVLYQKLEELKKKLYEKGYFNESLKKPIPKYPKKIGVITAPTGAVIKDIISTINRRYPLVEIILFPSLVQGDKAKDDLVRNLKIADTYNLDTIIIGRGGGSIEDLWAFNEEILAEAIYNAKTPIISAVGHEPDFSISDFVADIRAATPTAAAEIAVPAIDDLIINIKSSKRTLNKFIETVLSFKKHKLNVILDSYIMKNPSNLYEPKIQLLDNLLEKLKLHIVSDYKLKHSKYNGLFEKLITLNPSALCKMKRQNLHNLKEKLSIYTNNSIQRKTNRYDNLKEKLEALSPLKTLKRGYTITRVNNKIITNIKDIKKDTVITTEMVDGNIISKVMEVKNGN